MLNSNTIDKNILFNHFERRSTPLQKKIIEIWLTNPQNIELYDEYLEEWHNMNIQFVPDTDAALTKILKGEPIIHELKIKQPLVRSIYKLWAVAAVIFILLGGAFVFFNDVILNKTIVTAYGETKVVVLPDSSIVYLNANSSIQYPRFGFGKDEREVKLKGEADFSVIHTKSNQQFIVKTNNHLNVLVLGTQFTVYARGNNANVVLRKGKVSLSYLEKAVSKSVVLHPGDLFTTNNDSGVSKITHINSPEKFAAWKMHDFVFTSIKLQEIGKLLKENFGIEAKFEDETLSNTVICGSVHANNSDELIDAIAQLLDINYKIEKGTVYFFE